MEGKIKLMPLPAWKPNGRRTSVWGGTMLGIAKSTSDFEAAWQFAKHLYFSEELAESVYKTIGIISPVKETWNKPFYDKTKFVFLQPGSRATLCTSGTGCSFQDFVPL